MWRKKQPEIAPAARLVNTILQRAITSEVHEIRIETRTSVPSHWKSVSLGGECVVFAFRRGSEWREEMAIGKRDYPPLLARMRQLAKMDDTAKEGVFKLDLRAKEVSLRFGFEVRVECAPNDAVTLHFTDIYEAVVHGASPEYSPSISFP